jgi:hypothetical protein
VAEPANAVVFVAFKELLMGDQSSSPSVLLSVNNEVEAASIVAALGRYGVEASTSGDFAAGLWARIPGNVEILVRSADLEPARRALAEIRADDEVIDWSKVDVGQPEDE